MSQDPGICSDCPKREIYVEHPQSRRSRITADLKVSTNPSVSLSTPFDILWNPDEVEDEGRCANPACSEGQAEIRESLRSINRGIEHAARMGDWTDVTEREIERLEQLGEGALENVDESGIEWPNDERQDSWNDIEDEIDTLETTLSEAKEYTQQLYSQSGAGIRGRENISEITDALETLNDLEHRINETEVVADEQQALEDRVEGLEDRLQKEQDEKQELRDALQDERDEKQELRDELQKERDEKQELREKNQEVEDELQEKRNEVRGLRDENRELKDENLDLREENLELKEELLNLRSKTQHREAERGSEVGKADTTERDRDESEADTSTTVANGGAGNGAASQSGSEPTGSEQDGESKQTTESSPGRTSGFDPNRTLSQEEIRELELNSDWSQYNQPRNGSYPTADSEQTNEPDAPTREDSTNEKNDNNEDEEPGGIV